MVKVFTDASSNLFKAILDEKGLDITVLPMTLDLGDKRYVCYADDIDVPTMSKEFYENMRNGLKPKTSLMSPGLFMEVAEKAIAAGDDVIYVSLAGGISGSYQSACMIADQVNDEHDKEHVKVVNSKTAGFGEALVAIKACELAKKGLSLEEVYEQTTAYVSLVRSEFTVDNIMYLSQSGRVGKLTAVLANVLAIKPLLYGSDEGKIEITSKVHGRKAAIKTLANQCIEYIEGKDQNVFIAHCDALEDAKRLEEMLHEAGIKNTEIHFYDLITGAHVGPGTVAVFYEGTHRKMEKKPIIPIPKIFGNK